MRIALVSPYSWTYQGGVNRHVEALAEEFLGRGHHVRVFAPFDPPDRLSKLLHRGLPEDRGVPDYLVPLGRTVGIGANGSISNLSPFPPGGVVSPRRELNQGSFDVVHVHEPVVPLVGWNATLGTKAPLVGTFHSYSTKAVPNHIATLLGARRVFNRLSARIAVSEAAAWTGRRWFGGNYEIVPNGVDPSAALPTNPPDDHMRIVCIGRADERKGIPILLAAFTALTEHVPARLSLIGLDPWELDRYGLEPEVRERIEVHGKVSGEKLWREVGCSHVLCAPSLAGESFGMVLLEGFASGTPPIASRIAGYSDVVTDGVDGVLVPAGDAQALAEELQRLWHEPERLSAMSAAALRSAERYAWPHVADQVTTVYERAIAAPEPADAIERIAHWAGIRSADGLPPSPPQRLPSLDPAPLEPAKRKRKIARRVGLAAAGALGVGLTALAAQKIGVDNVVESIVRSDLTWVLVACSLMALSLFFRAASWYWIVRAALPSRPVRRRDVTSATMIGVLMSATLPARLGEPARAMSLARRIGRMRETFPVLLGTLVSQTMLNIVALALLGVIIVSTTDLFHSSTQKLFAFSFVPLILLLVVLLGPPLMRRNGNGRLARIGAALHAALMQVRAGLRVFRNPRRGTAATVAQLGAWAIQLAACWALLAALGLNDQAGIGAAAAVLFAVNVTAVVPATPSNIGVFQLAVISVLHTGFGVSTADALAYGVILQAVEIATAVALGLPALVREGLTWSDLRVQALATTPARLEPHPRTPDRFSSDRVPS
ncbi:MAG TPA: lysylphosphatidylglycerol synthase domain-containing protein [Solirubrobacterales bacterium]|nr:lysylphosphatidylglycerol synthase domain-containing protein [Solirubrobacterales bacterium]